MAQYRIIAHSEWSKGGNGEYPSRFVVLEWEPGWHHKFSSNEQIKDGRKEPSFAMGDYVMTRAEAMASMKERILRRNRHFGPGNVSHIPSGLKGITVLLYKRGK